MTICTEVAFSIDCGIYPFNKYYLGHIIGLRCMVVYFPYVALHIFSMHDTT